MMRNFDKAPYRSQVLMLLIAMGEGEELSDSEERYIADCEAEDSLSRHCANNIADGRSYSRENGSSWVTLVGAEKV